MLLCLMFAACRVLVALYCMLGIRGVQALPHLQQSLTTEILQVWAEFYKALIQHFLYRWYL